MYRARVQAVSGSKVYADGKWLSCIGNKNFRAGEMVWTDGRCAYGHFQESQQPLVITAEEDEEGVPILKRYYLNFSRFNLRFDTFQKNKLKQVGEMERPDNISATKWENQKLINNKRKVYIHNYLAVNVDKQGNIFVMEEFYKTNDNDYITEDKVVIFKNDKNSSELKFNKVKEIDLLKFFDDHYVANLQEVNWPMDATLAPEFTDDGHLYTTEEIGGIGYFSGLYVRRALIDDENNFELLIKGGIAKNIWLGDYVVANSGYNAIYQIKNDEIILLEEEISLGSVDYHFSQKGYLYFGGEMHYTSTKNINTITCSAGDGYYFTMTPERLDEYSIYAYGEYRCKFFSPDNQQIAELHGGTDINCLFLKVRGGYLINISGVLKTYNIFDQSTDERLGGIYFYSTSKKELKRLISGGCYNERLRPMKKIKGWQNRIKEISLNLEQDEN